MTGRNDIEPENLSRKGGRFFNKNLAIFSFFLLLSFIFWYLNALGKEIEAEIRFPVNYINLPKKKVIVREQPDKLNLYMKGSGYSIVKLKFSSNRSPVLIDMSKVSYKRVPGSEGLDYFLLTSELAKNLTVQLRSGVEVTSIKPDTLYFTLEESVQGLTLERTDITDANSKE